MKDLLKLPQTQLAYARSARLVEMHLDELCRSLSGEDYENARATKQRLVSKIEALGNLTEKSLFGWRHRVPLDDLYEFSEKEKDLLLDLYDAGGISRSRRMDERFSNLGGGEGVAKGAVTLSAGGPEPAWKVQITDRGREYVERVLLREKV